MEVNSDEVEVEEIKVKPIPVFQEDPNKIGTTLATIMEILRDMEIRQEAQNQQLKTANLYTWQKNPLKNFVSHYLFKKFVSCTFFPIFSHS